MSTETWKVAHFWVLPGTNYTYVATAEVAQDDAASQSEGSLRWQSWLSETSVRAAGASEAPLHSCEGDNGTERTTALPAAWVRKRPSRVGPQRPEATTVVVANTSVAIRPAQPPSKHQRTAMDLVSQPPRQQDSDLSPCPEVRREEGERTNGSELTKYLPDRDSSTLEETL